MLAVLVGCSGGSGSGTDAAMSAWQAGPRMPTRRLEPGVAALDGKLVVAGGYSRPRGDHVSIGARASQHGREGGGTAAWSADRSGEWRNDRSVSGSEVSECLWVHTGRHDLQ